MAIPISRAGECTLDKYQMDGGYGELEVLHGAYPLIHTYRCILKVGEEYTVKPFGESVLVTYALVKGKGYIYDDVKSYNVDEFSVYIPNHDTTFTVHAVDEMEFLRIVTDMTETDIKRFRDYHETLPLFRRAVTDGHPYVQTCQGPGTLSWNVVHGTFMGRICIGYVEGEGGPGAGIFEENGHAAQCQFNYAMSGADFYTGVADETVKTEEGDWIYIEAGLGHTAVANEPGRKVSYFWFEHFVEEQK